MRTREFWNLGSAGFQGPLRLDSQRLPDLETERSTAAELRFGVYDDSGDVAARYVSTRGSGSTVFRPASYALPTTSIDTVSAVSVVPANGIAMPSVSGAGPGLGEIAFSQPLAPGERAGVATVTFSAMRRIEGTARLRQDIAGDIDAILLEYESSPLRTTVVRVLADYLATHTSLIDIEVKAGGHVAAHLLEDYLIDQIVQNGFDAIGQRLRRNTLPFGTISAPLSNDEQVVVSRQLTLTA
jgi:hypothetical protein